MDDTDLHEKELSNDRALSSALQQRASTVVLVAIQGNVIRCAAAFCHNLL
jgi:hypothetical protein